MLDYRCYLLDAQGAIRSVEQIESPTDREALDTAYRIFTQRPHVRGFELWHRTRRIHLEHRSAH